MARPIAVGQVFGSEVLIPKYCAASQPFQADGGRFVYCANSSMTVSLINSSAFGLNLLGWAMVGTFSTSATVGADGDIAINVAEDAVYEMPINATQSETQLKALVGKVCDIIYSGGIQYAGYDTGAYDNIQIVGYKYYGVGSGEQTLLVKINSRNKSITSIA